MLELHVPEKNMDPRSRALNPSEKRATVSARETEPLARQALPSVQGNGRQPMESMPTQRTRAGGAAVSG